MSATALWMGPSSKKFLLVNAVTASRLVFAGIALIMISRGHWWPVASVLLLTGLVSDFLDGFLARRWNVTSDFGAQLDAQLDRLLLLSPIIGMGVHGDISFVVVLVLVVGLYIADIVAEQFELMRVVWWPACYAMIGYGLVRHASTPEYVFLGLAFAAASAFMVATHMSEVRRVWSKLTA